MYTRNAVLLILITLSLLGCDEIVRTLLDTAEQPSNPLVGTWSLDSIDGETSADIFGMSEDSVETVVFYDFYNDGTWQLSIN